MASVSTELIPIKEQNQSAIQELVIDPRYFSWEPVADSSDSMGRIVGRCVATTDVTLKKSYDDGTTSVASYKPVYVVYQSRHIGISILDLKMNNREIAVPNPSTDGEAWIIASVLGDIKKMAPNLTLEDVFLKTDCSEGGKEERIERFLRGDIDSREIMILRVRLK